jgi:adenylylsulfate kinase
LNELDSAENGWCVWVTGLPGSGKSVVSETLQDLLSAHGVRAQLLSSDGLRKVMTPKPTYSIEERDIVYSSLVYIAELLTQNGVNVIIDATGNLRRYRDEARTRIPRFVEVYLQCPMEICMEREKKRARTYHAPRKIYARALKGKSSTVPGIGQPYEEPLNAEIVLDTARCSPRECAEKILKKVEQTGNPRKETTR